MTTHTRMLTLLAATLLWVGTGCDESNRNLRDNQNYLPGGGFGVSASDPTSGTVNFPTNGVIKIAFTSAVDQGSLEGNYTLTRYVGNQSEDATELLSTPQMAGSNTMLVFTPNGLLPNNANYKLSLSSSIKSVAGSEMVGPFYLTFSTGNGGSGFGVITKEGPPTFDSLSKSWAQDDCLDGVVKFSESLAQEPQGWVKVKNALGIVVVDSVAEFTPVYQGETQSWFVFISCNCEHMGPWSKVEVRVDRAIDYDEEEMSSPTKRSFQINYGEGPCS